MDENQPRDPHPGTSFGVAQTLISSYLRAAQIDDRIAREAEASQYKTIDQARVFALGPGRYAAEFAERSLTAEIATTLGVHEAAASALLHEAEALVHDFPATLHALSDGSISQAHVRLLLNEAWSLPPELGAAFEAAALPLAKDFVASKFRREARKLRELLHTDSIAERLRIERAARKVTIDPGRDGMSWITLYLPSDQAAAISARLDFMGRRTASADDPRTRAQRELDIASELLQHGTLEGDATDGVSSGRSGAADGVSSGPSGAATGASSVRPTVFVTVPVMTLLGLSEEPGTLEGVGPIDADTARELAAEAPSFFRILTHPETGTWMSYGRDTYKVPADLKRYLRLRDGCCRFPGCTRRAVTGQLDHTVDWQHGGLTSVENLASLCVKHHRLKHNSDWRVAQLADGVVEWTSPAGRTHQTRPDSSFGGSGVGKASNPATTKRSVTSRLWSPRKPEASPRKKQLSARLGTPRPQARLVSSKLPRRAAQRRAVIPRAAAGHTVAGHTRDDDPPF